MSGLDTQAEELTAIFNRQIRPSCLMIVKTFPHVLLPCVVRNPKACLLAQLGHCYPFFHPFVLLSSFDLSCSPEEMKIGAGFDSRWCFPHWIALWFFLTGSWWIWCRQRCFSLALVGSFVERDDEMLLLLMSLSYYDCRLIVPQSWMGKELLSLVTWTFLCLLLNKQTCTIKGEISGTQLRGIQMQRLVAAF